MVEAADRSCAISLALPFLSTTDRPYYSAASGLSPFLYPAGLLIKNGYIPRLTAVHSIVNQELSTEDKHATNQYSFTEVIEAGRNVCAPASHRLLRRYRVAFYITVEPRQSNLVRASWYRENPCSCVLIERALAQRLNRCAAGYAYTWLHRRNLF